MPNDRVYHGLLEWTLNLSHDPSSVGEMVSDKVLRLNERRIRPTPRGRGVSGNGRFHDLDNPSKSAGAVEHTSQ